MDKLREIRSVETLDINTDMGFYAVLATGPFLTVDTAVKHLRELSSSAKQIQEIRAVKKMTSGENEGYYAVLKVGPYHSTQMAKEQYSKLKV